MLFVDGMNGVINHNETVQWLYTLTGSSSRLVVKTALKLLIVFVEYSESNSPLLIRAVNTVAGQRAVKPWSYMMEVLEERNGADTELLVFAMTLINKVSKISKCKREGQKLGSTNSLLRVLLRLWWRSRTRTRSTM
uniref:FHOD1/3-like FH3 domain-containing protein n=1 Tax=Pundamilia nyererei TaxID=303518 RepID=A0A3B4GLU5_9CICH